MGPLERMAGLFPQMRDPCKLLIFFLDCLQFLCAHKESVIIFVCVGVRVITYRTTNLLILFLPVCYECITFQFGIKSRVMRVIIQLLVVIAQTSPLACSRCKRLEMGTRKVWKYCHNVKQTGIALFWFSACHDKLSFSRSFIHSIHIQILQSSLNTPSHIQLLLQWFLSRRRRPRPPPPSPRVTGCRKRPET